MLWYIVSGNPFKFFLSLPPPPLLFSLLLYLEKIIGTSDLEKLLMKKNHSASLAFEETHLHLVNYLT